VKHQTPKSKLDVQEGDLAKMRVKIYAELEKNAVYGENRGDIIKSNLEIGNILGH
jgi:hypothetical protein